jgi:hypothetical protein
MDVFPFLVALPAGTTMDARLGRRVVPDTFLAARTQCIPDQKGFSCHRAEIFSTKPVKQ